MYVCTNVSVMIYIAVCCGVLQCVVVCCSVLQCVALCCSVLQCILLSPLGHGVGSIRHFFYIHTHRHTHIQIIMKVSCVVGVIEGCVHRGVFICVRVYASV